MAPLSAVRSPDPAAPTVENLPIARLVTDGQNLDRESGDVGGLRTSMREIGMLAPIIVRPVNGGRYEVVAGHRRLAAARSAGSTHIAAIVRDLSEDEKWQVRVGENLHRRELTPSEEGRLYQQLMLMLGYTQKQVAEMADRSQSHIAGRLDMLTWPPHILLKVDRGDLTIKAARNLLIGGPGAGAKRTTKAGHQGAETPPPAAGPHRKRRPAGRGRPLPADHRRQRLDRRPDSHKGAVAPAQRLSDAQPAARASQAGGALR